MEKAKQEMSPKDGLCPSVGRILTTAKQEMSSSAEKIKSIVAKLTLEEKISLLSGADYWHTTGIPRLGIPQLSMADGPHGLRKQKANELGINKSYPATCFPTAVLLACSWDEDLAKRQGELIGKEARSMGLSVVLGPGINIKRSPLCGRNFEYFSEDPLLSGRMGAGIVNGLQSTGVSACVKHFAVNNQEDYRFWVDAIADERTLREIYLASFEYALMYSKPKAFMSSYNKINGTFASENRWLLTDVLRGDWGYDGIVMSDWGAVNNRPQGVWAGLDLEMPGSFGVNGAEILKSVTGGAPVIPSADPAFDNTLSESDIDTCAERMLNFIFALEPTLEAVQCDFEPHHSYAREIAAECMVLLENGEVPYTHNKTNRLLPLKKESRIVVIGEMAEIPVYQGGGSSRIVPTEVDIPLEHLKEYANVTYLRAARFPLDKADKKAIKKADAVVIFAGTPDGFDTEGTDRTNLLLPTEQYALVDEVNELNINTVTVVSVGAPVMLPKSTGLLLTYLGGQGMGGAVAKLLFGVNNPCGKLAETFPMRVEDTPSFVNFPGDGETVRYGEGRYVGYRWYNKTQIQPRYEFGYGLSYTEFEYSEWEPAPEQAHSHSEISVRVSNVGEYDGKEIVQVYIDGELRGFKKVFLEKGESKTVKVEITPKAGQILEPAALRVNMFTQVKALWKIPNARPLFDEICALFKEEPTEELVNTRDCSKFVGNMLRNMVTMFDLGWSYADLQERIDKINKSNGL